MESNHIPSGTWENGILPEDENPDSKVHGANMGPIWGCQDPGGPHIGPVNFAILERIRNEKYYPFTTWNIQLQTNSKCVEHHLWNIKK